MPRRALATIAILALALALRFAFIDWGAPFTYHPDEHYLVQPATTIVASGDLNPHWFGYPSLLIYVEALLVKAVHAAVGTPLELGPLNGLGPWDIHPAQWKFVWAGRCASALLGGLGVWLVILAARRLGGSAAGYLAGLIVAVSPLCVENSHYLTTDVAAATLMTLALLLTQDRRLSGAALVAGLAASTKYTAGIILVVPLGAAVVAAVRSNGAGVAVLLRSLALVLAAAAFGFAVATPYALLERGAWWADVVAQRQHYLNAPAGDSLAFYLRTIVARGLTWPVAILLPVALVGAMGDRTKRADFGVVLLTSLLYLAILAVYPQHYERNAVLVIPLLAVFTGGAVGGLAHRLAPRWESAVVATAMLLLLPALVDSMRFVRQLALPDNRTVAYRWILDHVPTDKRLAREEYTPILAGGPYDTRFQWSLGFQDYGWYLNERIDYLVMSSHVYTRLMLPPYPAGAAVAQFYETIFAQLPLAIEFTEGEQRRGPTIRIYEVPHV